MNAYFVGITQQEKNNILDQHKKIYDGYRLIQQNNTEPQPLYVQDFANDKEGFVVNNKGDVKKSQGSETDMTIFAHNIGNLDDK